MKKILFIAIIFVVGCQGSPFQMQWEAESNRNSIVKLSPGQTKDNVLKTMGRPRKTELYPSEEENLELWFYLTEAATGYGRGVVETNYTPLVFENNKLIGWGNSYLDENIKKYELRIR